MRHCVRQTHFPINCPIFSQADTVFGTVFHNMTTAIFSHPICKQHEMGTYHPESPSRLQMIEDHLIASGADAHLDYKLAPEATVEDLLRVHTQAAVDLVRDNIPTAHGDYYPVDTDTLLNPFSWQAALRAAGAGIAATEAAITGQISNAFCLSRPIGHHATPSAPMGFCLFNNVAIAARYAMAQHGLVRVAIVDFDVHHGNGTEEAFLDDPRVLMVSFYQSPFYPYCGNENPRPHMINVPVPAGTNGDAVRELVNEKWLPALHAHQPEMIFISAGFDAHHHDPIGGMALVEDDFAWITRQVMAVADEYAQGRIVSFLEGGYALTAQARSAVAHVKALARLN